MNLKAYVTEFTASDGECYLGPMILADTLEAAKAIVAAVVRGPDGQEVRVMGEMVSLSETQTRSKTA